MNIDLIPFFSTYSTFLIYIIYGIRIFYNNYLLNELSTYLYGLGWGIGVTGLLIDILYYKQIHKKYNINKTDAIFGTLLVHLSNHQKYSLKTISCYLIY